MNVYTATFYIKPYLAAYLVGKWGKMHPATDKHNKESTRIIVEFTSDILLYDLIVSLTTIQPKNVVCQAGNIEIKVPAIRHLTSKKPSTHNYISKKNAKIFEQSVERLFKADFHEYLDIKKHEEGYTYKEASYMFLNKYCIDPDLYQPDSIRRHHSRWRNKIRNPRQKQYTRR